MILEPQDGNHLWTKQMEPKLDDMQLQDFDNVDYWHVDIELRVKSDGRPSVGDPDKLLTALQREHGSGRPDIAKEVAMLSSVWNTGWF
jgi:hypothetical protein